MWGCHWDVDPPQPDLPADRVFVMYDNIGTWFHDDVAEAGAAVAAGALNPQDRVIVYERESTGNVVYELVKDGLSPGGYAKREWQKYPPGENSSLSIEAISNVVGYIRNEVYPTATKWAFAFGSHGRGWIPKTSTVAISRRGVGVGSDGYGYGGKPFGELWAEIENPITRYFEGYGEKLEVADFATAFSRGSGSESWDWDMVLLDDCFMSSIEAIYEMQSLADYIIASPTEIMEFGFPYDRVVKALFNNWGEEGFKEIGKQFIDYYASRKSYPHGTVAVVKCAGLPYLADVVKAMNLQFNEIGSLTGIQFYDGFSRPGHVFYDLGGYIRSLRGTGSGGAQNSVLYNSFLDRMAQTVVYAGTTPTFFSMFPLSSSKGSTIAVDPDGYSGVSVFIPWSQTAPLFTSYRETKWCKDVYN
jgi:hypothetical protein